MKLEPLKKKVILSSIISAALIIATSFLAYMTSAQKDESAKTIRKIKNETRSIRDGISDLQTKEMDSEKYKKLWKSLSPGKKITTGIKIDQINATLAKVADKYSIIKPVIKVTLPEVLKDHKFKRKTINIIYTTASLKFKAASDVKALLFIDEFMKSLHGYPIITSLDISKDREYNNNDLVAISAGRSSGVISTKLNFVWYAYKEERKKKRLKDAK